MLIGGNQLLLMFRQSKLARSLNDKAQGSTLTKVNSAISMQFSGTKVIGKIDRA